MNGFEIGSLYPVWWETGIRDENDRPLARIMEVNPYRGRYTEEFTHVLKLHAPTTRRGWLEMTVDEKCQ